MPRWLMSALVEAATPNGYRAVATTDAPCHLWLRWSRNKPQRHPRAKVVRGLRLMGDVYYCFTAYNDIEQEEAGDTTEHTFIMSDWPICETRWFYLWGTIATEASPSESPIWGRHLYSDTSSLIQRISHNNDDAFLGLSVLQACPTSCPNNLCAGRLFAPAQKMGAVYRFRDLPIPRYSSINEAHITLTAFANYNINFVRTQIWAEQLDDAPDFSLDTFATAWARKNNSGVKINWDNIPNFVKDAGYPSTDISAVLEEIVNRPGWEAGNALVLFWNDYALRSDWLSLNMRCSYSYNMVPAKATYLTATYTEWKLEGVNP